MDRCPRSSLTPERDGVAETDGVAEADGEDLVEVEGLVEVRSVETSSTVFVETFPPWLFFFFSLYRVSTAVASTIAGTLTSA